MANWLAMVGGEPDKEWIPFLLIQYHNVPASLFFLLFLFIPIPDLQAEIHAHLIFYTNELIHDKEVFCCTTCYILYLTNESVYIS